MKDWKSKQIMKNGGCVIIADIGIFVQNDREVIGMGLEAYRVLARRIVKQLQHHGWSKKEIEVALGREDLSLKSVGMRRIMKFARIYETYMLGRAKEKEDKMLLWDMYNSPDYTAGWEIYERERKKRRVRIAEIVETIQGEGPYTGEEVLLLRMSGCNLRCPWCDTKWSWSEGHSMKYAQLLHEIDRTDKRILLLTGGEPMIWQYDIEFLWVLKKWRENIPGREIHIETNGIILPWKLTKDVINVWVVSPKVTVTGTETYWTALIEAWEREVAPYWKLVVDEDSVEIYKRLFAHFNTERIYAMPLGVSVKEIDKRMKDIKIPKHWKWTDRLQIREGFR